MIISNQTIEYKDKLADQYNSKINSLLRQMPSYCSDYEKYARNKNNLKTRMEYLSDIYNFFRYLVNNNPSIDSMANISTDFLEKLNGFDFDDYLAWLSNYKFDDTDETEKYKTNSNASKKRKMMAVKSLFHFLYVRDYISCNPTEKAIIPTVKSKKRSNIAVLEDSQCEQFLAQIDKEFTNAKKILEKKEENKQTNKDKLKPYLVMRDKAIVYLILGTGLRVSELCAINCSDISYDLGYINVIRKGDEDYSDTSDQVYLSDEVFEVLRSYIDIARDHISPNPDNYDALFISSKHSRITPRAIELMVKSYADAALGTNNNVHPHSLRATFGTRFYRMTKDIAATSTAMNHSGIEITARYYIQEDKNAKKNVKNLPISSDVLSKPI